MIDEQTKKAIKDRLDELDSQVILKFFEPKKDCEYCVGINEILDLLDELSKKITVQKYSFPGNESKNYNLEYGPAIVIESNDFSLKYFGSPGGMEFGAFLQTIIDTSKGGPNVSGDVKSKVGTIDFEVTMKVFVSPTCPYCPSAMKSAYDFAMLNKKITTEVYEINEFPEISKKYQVQSVPRTIINEKLELVGSHPPDLMIQKILGLKKKE